MWRSVLNNHENVFIFDEFLTPSKMFDKVPDTTTNFKTK